MSKLLDAFVGGMYTAISPTFGADQCVNAYAETRRVDGSAKQKCLIGTPGLRRIVTGSGTGNRGWFSQDGLTVTVIGPNLYAFTASTGVLTSLGTISDDGGMCSFASNGQGGDQLAIVGGSELKILNLLTLALSSAVSLPFSGPVAVVFLDGYFLINQRTSPIIWFSALEDGTTWDALDFFARSGTSDNIVTIGVTRNRVWAFGTRTTTLFYDSGDADTPFLPYPETATQIGAVTPAALTRREDVFRWLAQDGTGTPRIVQATADPSPATISTPPIEAWLAACTTLTDAYALTYLQDGHEFWALTCPSSPDDIKTYVWDAIEQLWHARAGWNAVTGAFTRWRARGCVQIGGAIYVGDAEDARIYTLDLDAYDDDGDILRALRRTPYVSDENQWLFIDQVELAAQVGIGLTTGQGVAPVADLRISRDAAKTWVSAGSATLGALGDYLARAVWRRLGRVRSDRLVLEVTQTDPCKRAWLGLYLRSTAGTGQL